MKRRRKIRREGSFDEHWIRVINFPSLFFLNINFLFFFQANPNPPPLSFFACLITTRENIELLRYSASIDT